MSAAPVIVDILPRASDSLELAFVRGGGDQKSADWFRRLSRAKGRFVIAQSQLRRLTAMEERGREVDTAAIHVVEQELSDAAGAMEFCRQVLKHGLPK